MRFSGVTLAIVSPVNPELTDRLVQSLSTIISFGASAYDLVIKFGPLVTFFVLIYSLGNDILLNFGTTTFSFAYFSYHWIILIFRRFCK